MFNFVASENKHLLSKKRCAFLCLMEKALENAKAAVGGSSGLARAISEATGYPITPQAVGQWRVVPPTRVLAVEKITGISRYELRPDIYGPAPQEITP